MATAARQGQRSHKRTPEPSIRQKTGAHIGHAENLGIGQQAYLFLGQMGSKFSTSPGLLNTGILPMAR